MPLVAFFLVRVFDMADEVYICDFGPLRSAAFLGDQIFEPLVSESYLC